MVRFKRLLVGLEAVSTTSATSPAWAFTVQGAILRLCLRSGRFGGLRAISCEVPVMVTSEATWASASACGCGVARGGVVVEGSGVRAELRPRRCRLAPEGGWDLAVQLFVEQRLPLQEFGFPLMCGFSGHRQPFLPVWVVLMEVYDFQ